MKKSILVSICYLSALVACTTSVHAVELVRSGLRVGFNTPLSAPRWIQVDPDIYSLTSWTSRLGFSAGLVGDLKVGGADVLVRFEPSFRQFESTSLFDGVRSYSGQSLELTSQQAIIELPASIVYRFGDSASMFRPYGLGGLTFGLVTTQNIESIERDAANADQPPITRQQEFGFSSIPLTLQVGCGAEVTFGSGISLLLDGRLVYTVHGFTMGPQVYYFSSTRINIEQMVPPVPTLAAAGGVSLLVRM